MNTIITLSISLFALVLFTPASAQQNVLVANSALVQADIENNTMADLSSFEVREFETRVYFKLHVENGDASGVLVLEKSDNGTSFEVVEFKDLVPVAADNKILYCFSDGVVDGKVTHYRVTVATANYSEVLGEYTHGVVTKPANTETLPLTTTVY